MTTQRCPWCGDDPLYQQYHDEEWGVPCNDDKKLFEFLILEAAQAGLSWITVLRKRDAYRSAFADFDAPRVAKFGKREVTRLINNPGIVRNRLKIEAAISNARLFLELQAQQGSFSHYLWQFVDGKPQQNQRKTMKDVPATTPLSDIISKDMKKRGFRFFGSTICYAHLQAMGVVNDHLVDCHAHKRCKALARNFEP